MTAALAALLAVILTATSGTEPGVVNPPADSSFASLVADLTIHPSAHPSDAAAILRQLANTAAKQPAVPLGPVEFSQIKSWEPDLGAVHYGLGYVSHMRWARIRRSTLPEIHQVRLMYHRVVRGPQAARPL
jgi:hypothetical protein